MHATAEAHAPAEELVVQVGEVRDLFAAPDVDPLAQNEGEMMGEPALLRVVRRLRGMLILLVCVGVSTLFRSETVTFLPPLVNNALGEGFNVIGWVMLWRPVWRPEP